jgi:DNA primase
MAKVSPVSIKYMIHANFSAEGALEKPDVIGALFGQTEGLLGAELEMRELQKEGKIGRIEVDLQRDGKRTVGKITIPTALDQSETTLIAAAVETIERIGPSDSQIEVEKIEDVRGSKRDYILERAKKLMQGIQGSSDSREISNAIKTSVRVANIQEYGDEKLPFGGDLESPELVVVEGRADVVNLMRAGVNNVIGMSGTKLPDAIKELGKSKDLTLFVDGDRGGKLIIQNVTDNANIKYIAIAPDGKEVEELAGKEILMNLRKRIPLEEYFRRERYLSMNSRNDRNFSNYSNRSNYSNSGNRPETPAEKVELDDDKKQILKDIFMEIEGTGKAILLDSSLKEIKSVSARGLNLTLRKISAKPSVLVIDGAVTGSLIEVAEEIACQIIVAKNFSATSEKIQMLSF